MTRSEHFELGSGKSTHQQHRRARLQIQCAVSGDTNPVHLDAFR